MRYDDYVKRIVSKMLGAKSNKYKFMDIQKKLLDIIYIIILSKNIYKKKMLSFYIKNLFFKEEIRGKRTWRSSRTTNWYPNRT